MFTEVCVFTEVEGVCTGFMSVGAVTVGGTVGA